MNIKFSSFTKSIVESYNVVGLDVSNVIKQCDVKDLSYV